MIYTYPDGVVHDLQVKGKSVLGETSAAVVGIYGVTPVGRQLGCSAAEATVSQILTSVCAMHSAIVGLGIMAGT